MKILVFGAGVQGTLHGVRLARSGHDVTLIARGRRAQQLAAAPAVVEHALSGVRMHARLPVHSVLRPDAHADLCLVTVRYEQLPAALPALARARGISRFLFLLNKIDDWQPVLAALGRERVVLGFLGAAGTITADGVVRYVDVRQQPTALEAGATDLRTLLRAAGFATTAVADMPAWLQRHALFVTAVCGSLYGSGNEPARLAASQPQVRRLVLAVRQGWQAMDARGIAGEPLALRAIFRWVPLPLATRYWQRLLAAPEARYYFAEHARHARAEMAALAADLRRVIEQPPAPALQALLDAAITQPRAERQSSRLSSCAPPRTAA